VNNSPPSLLSTLHMAPIAPRLRHGMTGLVCTRVLASPTSTREERARSLRLVWSVHYKPLGQ
jgi:hypothetical protein